jgi:uncharacterized protein (TIGR03083 family)
MDDRAELLAALHRSADGLQALAGSLDGEGLQRQSYCADWSVASVFSHLGAQGQIFGSCVDASLAGTDPPGTDQFETIWAGWNAKPPRDQVTDAIAVDQRLLERFSAFADEAHHDLVVSAFGMQLDAATLFRMRLSEHVVHSWDVAVAFEPQSVLPGDAASMILVAIPRLVAHRGTPSGLHRSVAIELLNPSHRYLLEIAETLTLTASDAAGSAQLRLPTEAFVRLVYGRLDPDHTPAYEAHGVELDELRQMFPGL